MSVHAARRPSRITCTDLFCGAGGSSQGAEDAGISLVMAVNHWDRAIETHSSNFQAAGHDCRNISDDCWFRMLTPAEIGLGMAFPDDYVVTGNKREKVRQYGQGVTPPVARWILSRIVDSLR